MQVQVRLVVTLTLLFSALAWPASIRAQVDPWPCEASATLTAPATPAISAKPNQIPFPGGRLIVFAAASLTDAFTRIGEDITAANRDVHIQFNFAGSQTLVTQLEGGADADVLALASPEQMTHAVDQGVPVDDPISFATNRLTIVVPSDNPADIQSPADLSREGVRLLVANPDVPAGAYARQAICQIGASAGAAYVEEVAGNVVSQEDNVRSVLTKVQLGEADAGIVYETDARTADESVDRIEIPDAQNIVASYPIVSLEGDRLGMAFIGYVLSAEGQATLASFGFGPVD